MSRRPLQVAILLGSGVVAACAAPDKAPHQPITGVDRPREPEPDVRGTARQPTTAVQAEALEAQTPVSTREPIEEFADRIAAAHRSDPGPIAVFPATSVVDGAPRVVNGLGESLMRSTADALRKRGVQPVWDAERLEQRLREENRSPQHLQAGADPLALARRIGARYAVFGGADEGHDGPRMDRDDYFVLRWHCRQPSGPGDPVADLDREIRRSHPEFASSHRLARREARWPSGPPADPDLEAEVMFLGRAAVASIAEECADFLGDADGQELRIAVLPLELPRTLEAQRQLLVFANEFEKARAQLEAKHGPRAALEQPALIGSQQYGRLADALDDYRILRRELRRSHLGELSSRLARRIADELCRRPEIRLQATPDETVETAILSVIREEARRHVHEASIDPDTIAWFQAEGSQLMLRSAIEQGPQGAFSLDLQLTRLDSGRSLQRRLSFEPWLDAALERELGR